MIMIEEDQNPILELLEDTNFGWKPLEEQNIQLRTMLGLSRILGSTLELDGLLEVIIRMATEFTNTEAASILLLDQQTGNLHFAAATGVKQVEIKSLTVPIEGSIAGWIVDHNQPLVVNETHDDPRHYVKADEMTQFVTQSIMGVPLRVKDKTIGVLEVLNKHGIEHFSDQDQDTLQTLAAQAAVAIENARLYQDLHNQMRALEEAQARLVQSEKLAAVGELVAGVAHELNNPLTTIIGFAELLKFNGSLNERDQFDLDRIITQGQRAATIVRGLLDFARQQPPKRSVLQINDVIKSTINLLNYKLASHNIEIETQFAPKLPPIMGDQHQLQQVMVNLLQNAFQAVQSQPKSWIRISTKLITDRPETVLNGRPAAGKDKRLIQITLQDNGPGIKPKHLSRIFNPFFTTKQPGEGTGLGLSICHGIINEHGGRIWVESKPGCGTAFFIEVPVALETTPFPTVVDQINQTETQKRDATTNTASARILVIDDEMDVLSFLMRLFQKQGYRVDAVSDGQVALACLSELDYDLILCDIRMPKLSGIELYRRLQKRAPSLTQRLVFITGDIISPATRRFLVETGAPCLRKPFQTQTLLDKIKATLTTFNNLAE